MRFYSVRLPCSSDVRQKHLANKLASRIGAKAEQALTTGDWNCLAPVLFACLQCLFLLN